MDESSSHSNRRRLPAYAVLGLTIILFAKLGLLLQVHAIGVFFTPIVWTGYIFFVDGITWWRGGHSLITSRSRDFLWMLPWSVICWLVFEVYNLYLQNWSYTGLPDGLWLRLVGYVWSFATIIPAILVTTTLLESITGRISDTRSRQLSEGVVLTSIGFGLLFLLLPLVVDQAVAGKLFGFVWIGFIFLLDPINHRWGRPSVMSEAAAGDFRRLLLLMLAGFVCGILWESWNSWAIARWEYTVPIECAGPKIFEMPLLGYLGFLPFAVECYVMNEYRFVLFGPIHGASR